MAIATCATCENDYRIQWTLLVFQPNISNIYNFFRSSVPTDHSFKAFGWDSVKDVDGPMETTLEQITLF